jgi:recombinational DNA repair protein (RecF pathway)
MSSKLRFILQDFSHLKIDLVRGKDFWRITSASKMNELREIKKEKRKLSILVNISNLLKRLLAGEEPNHPLFANLLAGFLFLEKSRLESEWRNIEIIIVLRTLHHLGYLRGSEWLNRLLQLPWGEDLIQEANRERNKILSEINRALEGSQL